MLNLGTIELRVQGTAIALGPRRPMESRKSMSVWREMWVEILTFAYLNLPACLITFDPQSWSLAREFSTAPAKKVNGHEYLVVLETQCSTSLLQTIAQSEDFTRGLLLLSSQFSEQLTRAYEVIQASSIFRSPPANCKDVLLCVADGTILWWLNPSHSTRELIRFVSNLSYSRGFAFDFNERE
jgi:hypothetical protein